VPPFCGASVIACSGFGADAWAQKLEEIAPCLKPLLVMRHADLARLSKRRPYAMSENEGWVIIVAENMIGAFHDVYGGFRFSRLVIDDAGSITRKYLPRLRACFTWLVESTVEQYILPLALAPDQRAEPNSYRDVCSVLQEAGMTDISRVVVRHSLAEVVRECRIEFPLHVHYECSDGGAVQQLRRYGRTWDGCAGIRPLELSNTCERERVVMLLRTGAQVCADVQAASRGVKKDARERIAGWKKDKCCVCWSGLAGEERGWGETCVTSCCSQLMCFECMDKISGSPMPRCPICRANVMESGMRLLTELPHPFPPNLRSDRSALWNRRVKSTLTAVLIAMPPGSRVVLWSFAHVHHLDFNNLGFFVERHGFSSCRPLNGSKYQIRNALKRFNEDRDAIDAAERKAVFMTAAWEARGCHLHAATDIVFLGEVSTSVYRHVMARVLNVSNPSIQRRCGPLRVHMLHCKGRSYPELFLAGEGLGMGADPESYAATIR
jgi:hypothetical protein